MVMARNVAVVIEGPDGTERAVHRVQYGARLKVDEGDQIKRGQRIAEWDPYTRPILTEVDGVIGFEDLVEGASMTETIDEATGIAKRMVIDWRLNQRSADVQACDRDQGRGRQDRQAAARRRRPLHAAGRVRSSTFDPGSSVQRRRHRRAYLDGIGQDPRHHRRSAARRGIVRGAPSEGSCDHRRGLRHGAVRPRLQEQDPDLDHSAARKARSRSNI